MGDHIQWFHAPGKLYFKQGCLPVALRELKYELHKHRVLIVTDQQMQDLAFVTNCLSELGLIWAAASPDAPDASGFAPDCILAVGTPTAWDSALTLSHQYEDGSLCCIIIPTVVQAAKAPAWRDADMVILDEDLIGDDAVQQITGSQILSAAHQSLSGANASDYTLAWAVQAMRMMFDGNGSKSTLLHAAALSALAVSIAVPEEEPESKSHDFLSDAAKALGMSTEALENRISNTL